MRTGGRRARTGTRGVIGVTASSGLLLRVESVEAVVRPGRTTMENQRTDDANRADDLGSATPDPGRKRLQTRGGQSVQISMLVRT